MLPYVLPSKQHQQAHKGLVGVLPKQLKNLAKYIVNMEVLAFKKAKLVKPASSKMGWYVEWYNTEPETKKLTRIRKTFDLGRIEDEKTRELTAMEYIFYLDKALENGYNFFIDDKQQPESLPNTLAAEHLPEIAQAAEEKHWSDILQHKYINISAALTASVKQKQFNLTKKSYAACLSGVKIFNEWLTLKKLHRNSPNSITPDNINDFMQHELAKGKTNRTVSGILSRIAPIFDELEALRIIKVSPFKYVKRPKKKADSGHFAPLTVDELMKVKAHLSKEHPRLLLFGYFIFYAFLRNNTIGRLQRKDIDFEGMQLHINGEDTKSGRTVTKQLVEPLAKALKELEYDKLPPEHYLFTGKGLKPGAKYYETIGTRATEAWKEHVIDALKINKKLYALKHTAGQMYINNTDAPDLDWLQRQMEHTSLETTNIYVKSRKLKVLDSKNLNLPDF
ncbi:MAG: site-specific integrase [Chitinophagia bacterium]|nr:site-specific integrase [Chitinophagia bacterium]